MYHLCMKKKFLTVLLVIGAFSAYAQYTNEIDFTVKIIDNAVQITWYKGSNREVSIPPRIQNLPVTSIGDVGFAENNLISVTIPNSVTSIESTTFMSNQLASVTIPNSVTTIGHGAFTVNPLIKVEFLRSDTSITDSSWDSYTYSFPHNQASSSNLNAEYSVGGAGVYTRPDVTSESWTRQP